MASLDIDTDELRSLVTTAQRANDSITEAMNLLNQITTHEDWKCPQRTTINNYTTANRKTAQTIQENASSFYQAIKTSSEQFDQAEQDAISKQSSVDDAISRIASVMESSIASPAAAVITGFTDLSES